tara:strand:- start:714 stop:845 length:132 start_codon:yes stop_codon:yes gene_type:complete
MKNKSEYLIDLILMKLKKINSRKINLEKDEFIEFIDLLKNNER